MNSKRPSLVVPILAIALIVAGMTQQANARTQAPEVRSATTGITSVERLLDRIANRAASRRDDADDAPDADTDDAPRVRRVTASSSSSSSSSRSRSTRTQTPASSSQKSLRNAAPSDPIAEVYRLVNAEREAHDLPAYSYNNTLERSADAYAGHMEQTNCFSHSECGSTLKERMHESGYYKANGRSYSYGENIARGQDTAAEVMRDWLNSPSHRDAILSSKFKEIGIGKSGKYWVQHFGAVR